MNLSAFYIYRDSSNNKQESRVVFPGEVSPDVFTRLQALVTGGDQILPAQVGLDVLYDLNESHYDDDHIWHELIEVSYTPERPTRQDMTAAQFAAQFDEIVWNEGPAVAELEKWLASSPHGPLDEDNDDACEYR